MVKPWGLKSGERIGIIQSHQKRIEGRFQGFTDSAISLSTDRLTTVPRSDVVRVYRPPRINRTKRALIGGAIGLAAGALLTNTAGDRFRNEGMMFQQASGLEALAVLELQSAVSVVAVIKPCINAHLTEP
jgi:hypothetical protein